MRRLYLIVYVLVALIAVTTVMAYFVRPHPPSVELVTEEQELPDPRAHYFVETGLATRVSKSYGIALVLVISEFSRKNAVALEAVRSWAHDRFQREPSFLHSVGAQPQHRAHLSIIDAFCYSLFDPPLYLLEGGAMQFLKQRIADFHTTKAYLSFRSDYFDSFGLDHESALLLAKYQSERALQSVDILLSAAYFVFAIIVGIISFLRYPIEVRSTRHQRMLALFWFTASLFYIILSWVENDVSVLVSSLLCAVIGLYIRRPIAVSFGEDKGLSFRLLVPNRAVILVATWATVSFVAVQLFTWLHYGTVSDPDPITLLISALTGDFLHDPSNAKRYILRITGALWLLLGLWTLWAVQRQTRSSENVEEALGGLKDGL